MHDRTLIDGGDLDRHITQYPEAGRLSDSIAEAIDRMEDATDEWVRANLASFRALRNDWLRKMMDTWDDTTSAYFDADFLPYCEIDDLFKTAKKMAQED